MTSTTSRDWNVFSRASNFTDRTWRLWIQHATSFRSVLTGSHKRHLQWAKRGPWPCAIRTPVVATVMLRLGRAAAVGTHHVAHAGQVTYLARPESAAMRLKRQLGLPPRIDGFEASYPQIDRCAADLECWLRMRTNAGVPAAFEDEFGSSRPKPIKNRQCATATCGEEGKRGREPELRAHSLVPFSPGLRLAALPLIFLSAHSLDRGYRRGAACQIGLEARWQCGSQPRSHG
jgi:hypothetical protein